MNQQLTRCSSLEVPTRLPTIWTRPIGRRTVAANGAGSRLNDGGGLIAAIVLEVCGFS